jgi:hypothetical protein
MSEIIITKKQLAIIQENISKENNKKIANENWENFSKEQREYIVEFFRLMYPNKVKKLNENTWLNTLGDIVGIVDPTGLVDLVNGVSYIYQGDYLFGFLSVVSAVPYAGDAIAKPVMGALKVGAPSAKALEEVLKLSKAGKTAEASAMLTRITENGGVVGKFTEGMGKIGSSLRGILERLPVGPFGGLKRTILQWIDLFEKGAVKGAIVNKAGANLASKMGTLSKATQVKNLENLIKMSKESGKLFRGYRTTKGFFSGKTLFRGMPQLIGRNASVRALARQTKWWAGFLDFMGLGNFVGPDEALAKLGKDHLEDKIAQYNQTPQAQQYFKDSFGNEIPVQPMVQAGTLATGETVAASAANPVGDFFTSLLGGQAAKTALTAL